MFACFSAFLDYFGIFGRVSVHLRSNEGERHEGGPFQRRLFPVFGVVEQRHEKPPAFFVAQQFEVVAVVIIEDEALF